MTSQVDDYSSEQQTPSSTQRVFITDSTLGRSPDPTEKQDDGHPDYGMAFDGELLFEREERFKRTQRRLLSIQILLLTLALVGLATFVVLIEREWQAITGVLDEITELVSSGDNMPVGDGNSTPVAQQNTTTSLPEDNNNDGDPTIRPTSVPTATRMPTTVATDAATGELDGNTSERTPFPTPTPGEETTDIYQYGIEMVYVPAGQFMMGDSALANAAPHQVELSAYYIDRYEVTNIHWARCVDQGECSPPSDTSSQINRSYYDNPDFEQYPVINITWKEAQAFCEWRGARLPTEAEWEKAARWDPEKETVSTFPWGDQWDASNLNSCDADCALRQFANPAYQDDFPELAPVGSFADGVSAVGAFDLLGNVSEWVADWFGQNYYRSSPATDPTGPTIGNTRVVRGGSWGIGDQRFLSAVFRSDFAPSFLSNGLGFRCAISEDEVVSTPR